VGPDDLRPIRTAGRHPRPKWKNSLDWAKVMARKEDPPILARTRRWKGGKLAVLVLVDHSTDPEWLAWVQRTPKNKFRKKCRRCRRWVRLSAKACPMCFREFPTASARRHKLPHAEQPPS
jgi:hypothetical protein